MTKSIIKAEKPGPKSWLGPNEIGRFEAVQVVATTATAGLKL